MAKNKRSKKTKANAVGLPEADVRQFFVYAIAVWLFVLPLLVHIKEAMIPRQMQDLYMSASLYDFFAYYKAIWLWGGALFFFFCARIFRFKYKRGDKWDKLVIALIVFALAIVLSYLFSPFKSVTWLGYLDRFEGTLSWLSYCLAAYAVYGFVDRRAHNLILIKAIVLSAGVVGLIGALQYFQIDFLKSNFAKMLMLGKYYSQLADQLKFTMPVGQSYTTLYNPNYVGSFVAVTLPLTFYMIKQARNQLWRALYSLIAVALLISLVGSKSTGGLIAVAAVVVAYGLYLLYRLRGRFKRGIWLGGSIALLIVSVALAAIVFNNPKVQAAFKAEKVRTLGIVAAQIVDNQIDFSLQQDKTLRLLSAADGLAVDLEGARLVPDKTADDYDFYTIEQLAPTLYIYVEKSEQMAIKRIMISQREDMDTKYKIVLFYAEDGFYIGQRPIEPADFAVAKTNLIKNEAVFSFRGYIWNRTLPLIGQRPLLGRGADSFALAFPQVDPIGRIGKYQGNPLMLVDKAHSLYLTLLVNFGLVGSLAYAALLALAFIKRNSYFSLALIGFLVAGIVNDSIIALQIIVFVLIALYPERAPVDEVQDGA